MRRVGLLGFGSIAEHGHLPALQRFENIEVLAVADLSTERLARAHEVAPNAQLFGSPLQLIERAEVDVLDICTPPSTHADLIEAACGRGIREIACEKPFVLGQPEFDRVARIRRESGARIACVNNWRSSDLNRLVSTVLADGNLGQVREVRLLTARPDAAKGNAGWLPSWRTDLAHAGGGIVLDHGWHQLYLVFGWMARPLESLEATVRTLDARHAPVEDDAVLDLYFSGDGRARIELTWTARERRNEGRILCERGEIEVHDDRIVVVDGDGSRTLPFGDRLTQSSYHPEWFETFFRCTILDGNSQEADRNFTEAGLLVRTVAAAYRSGREGGSRITVGPDASGDSRMEEKVGSLDGGSGMWGASA